MTTADTITVFGQEMPCGGHRRAFEAGACRVLVEPSGRESDADAAALTEALAGEAARWGELHEQLDSARLRNETLLARIALLERQVPPARPEQLLAPGYVRFTGERMFLLGKRETGWSAWGFQLNSWDELFRRYDVKVVEFGEDEHGQWWKVVNNARAASKAGAL